jgi:pSer/pThr/pTyr-binding forkhead associated (FHA) protein
VLIDLQSKNGSFVNERIVSTHWLNDGDVISIGKHSLTFAYTDGEQIPNSDSDKIEKTMIMDTSQYRSMMKKSKPNASQAVFKYNDINSACGLAFLAGGYGKINLSNRITKIGKHPESDIVIKSMWVGQTAATISKRPDGFHISYVGGWSKPKINDKAIKHSVLLNDLDVIDIGPAKLQFHDLSHSKTRMLTVDKDTGQPTAGTQ